MGACGFRVYSRSWSRAYSAAWVRSRSPSRLRMFDTWFFTVPSLTYRRPAISRLVAPRAMSRPGLPVALTSQGAEWNFGAENWSYSEGNES